MSYPYDTNPWDDNYTTSAPTNTGQQQQASQYSLGYNNNSAQQYQNYEADSYNQQQQYQYENQKQEENYTPDYNADEQNQQKPPPPQRSALRRFLSQHIPLCGAFMDTMSGINLPFIDALVQHINRDLLISKIFYFFFYSAFGSLFPLMGVYFKQLGMNPAQVGILTGVRPFIEIFSAPFWHSLADRFHKSKALLIFSLLSWIVFTYSLAHIRPPASACVAFNDTYYVLYTPYSNNDLSNFNVEENNEAVGSMSSSDNVNEMFMNKPPPISEEKEGKDAILASEENQNDQRRRRRRRRKRSTSEQPSSNRFFYSIAKDEQNSKNDDGYEINTDLDIGDLENDFDDKYVLGVNGDKENANAHHHKHHSYFAHDEANDDSEYDEMQQSFSRAIRYKRSSERKMDDLLGESEDIEPEEEEEKNREKVAKEKENSSSSGDEEQGDEREAEAIGDNEKENKNRFLSTSTPTTTTTTTESSSQFVQENQQQVNKTKRIYKQRHKTPPTHIVGMSPITVEYAVNYNKEKHSKFVTPMFSTIVYKLDDIKGVFFLLLLLISLGEFFSAPALTLADSATLSYLGENTDLYGRQRMFGSLSWAITLLLVGMALDNSTSIADHPCGPHQRERSYTVCFIIFSLLMFCALLTATQFRFNYPKGGSGGSQALIASTTDSNTVVTRTVDGSSTGNIDDLYASTQPRSIFNTAPPVNAPPPNIQQGSGVGGGKEKFEFLDKWKSAVFAQNTWELPEWVNVFRQFKNSLHLTYLFITWFLGCGVGLVFTFLFWHLQDVGGTPTLFGICSVINHISEILAYFFSFSFIKRFGHTRVLSVGLGCNVIRFLYVAFLTNPYYALPFELVQGITHAACFAACCSYISHVSKPELRTSTQGVMQGLHHGIGRACGALLGGFMINAIGSRASFCIYGLLSGCVLAGFLYVRKKVSQMEDEEVKVDESEALGGYGAPQGVPSAIPGKLPAPSQTTTTTTGTVPTQEYDYQW